MQVDTDFGVFNIVQVCEIGERGEETGTSPHADASYSHTHFIIIIIIIDLLRNYNIDLMPTGLSRDICQPVRVIRLHSSCLALGTRIDYNIILHSFQEISPIIKLSTLFIYRGPIKRNQCLVLKCVWRHSKSRVVRRLLCGMINNDNINFLLEFPFRPFIAAADQGLMYYICVRVINAYAWPVHLIINYCRSAVDQ